jgi:hypothetical protein
MSEEEKVKKKEALSGFHEGYNGKYNIPLERVYNADQTGLFFNKLPNRIYVDKVANDYHGVKQMKSKDWVTLMVATSAVGEKFPLFMLKHQNALDCVMESRPCHITIKQMHGLIEMSPCIGLAPQQHGNVYGLWFLDNCPANYNLDLNKLPKKLLLLFFPPNRTSFL